MSTMYEINTPVMSRRDMFAMAALQGMIANGRFKHLSHQEVAMLAVEAGDAMIAALDRPAEEGA